MVGRRFVMKCVPEPTNRFDRHAVKVMAPSIDEISEDDLDVITRGHPNYQVVQDILGQTIGHVPKLVCNIISIPMLVQRCLRHAICIFMGEMEHDHQGPKLKVIYLLEYESQASIFSIVHHMKRANCVPSDNFFC